MGVVEGWGENCHCAFRRMDLAKHDLPMGGSSARVEMGVSNDWNVLN